MREPQKKIMMMKTKRLSSAQEKCVNANTEAVIPFDQFKLPLWRNPPKQSGGRYVLCLEDAFTQAFRIMKQKLVDLKDLRRT